jgi:hypothetical protein
MPTQHIRRIRTMTLETFKILNGLAPPVLSNLVQKQDHKYNFRYTNLLQIPQVKSPRYGKSSFRYAYGIHFQTIIETVPISMNLKILFLFGMVNPVHA